jgi:hypothetical protein
MTCGHWDKAHPSDSPFANLSRDEVRALAKTSLTEHLSSGCDTVKVQGGPVNDGFTLGKRQLNFSITGPPSTCIEQMWPINHSSEFGCDVVTFIDIVE